MMGSSATGPGSLFSFNSPPAAAPAAPLFGVTQQQQQPTFGGGLFQPTNVGSSSFGMFGSAQPNNFGNSGFGGGGAGLFGNQQLNNQVVPVRETTTYEQLPVSGTLVCQSAAVAIQRKLEQNRQIRKQIESATDVGERAKELSASVSRLREALKRAENAQQASAPARTELVAEVGDRLKTWADDLAAKALGPPAAVDTVELPAPLLWQHKKRCEDRLEAYSKDIDALATTVATSSVQAGPSEPDRLTRLLKTQFDAFSRVARSLTASHSRLEDLKTNFLRQGRDDIFAKRDREEAAERRRLVNRIRADAATAPKQPQLVTIQQQQQQSTGMGNTAGAGAGAGAWGLSSPPPSSSFFPSPPSFGSPSPVPTFGSATSAFGSTPAFGSTSAFGTKSGFGGGMTGTTASASPIKSKSSTSGSQRNAFRRSGRK